MITSAKLSYVTNIWNPCFSLLGNTNNINLRVRLDEGSGPGLILWTGDGLSAANDHLMIGVDENGHVHYR